MIRQRAAIAGLQLIEPLPPVAAQRLVAGYALAEQQSLYGDFSVKRKTIYAAPFLILSVLAACG
jgi:hypothetical protein